DPLSAPDCKKLLDYMPKDALVLVLGYGGQDRRIMDLVEAILNRGGPPGEHHVMWVHFESERPKSVESIIKSASTPPLVTARTFDAGALLIGLYTQLTSSQPTSAASYGAHSQRPLGLVYS